MVKGWNPWLVGFTSFVALFFVMASIYGTTKVLLYQYPPSPYPKIPKEMDINIFEKRIEYNIPPQYRVAIVIDDIGLNIARAREFIDINLPISFAVLPFLSHSSDIAKELNTMGRDVLLHLPMEPQNYPEEDPGEGSLFTSMSDEDIIDQLTKDMEAIPYARGVNNHMGSKFSEDPHKMMIVLEAVKESGFFFLDSKTTAKTTGYTLAKELGLKALDRQVFLDNDKDVEHTIGQFEELIRIAKERGSAIAIGHPHKTTIAALKEMIDRFEEERIEVVPISKLLD